MNLEPLYSLIRTFEGCKLKPYLCPAGVPTIGYGHTGKDVTMESAPITFERAEALMISDAARFAREASKISPILLLPWNNSKLCAIASFCYNLGIARYKASTLRKKVDAGDWEGAQDQIVKWVYAGGKKLKGLESRRNAERLMLKSDWIDVAQ